MSNIRKSLKLQLRYIQPIYTIVHAFVRIEVKIYSDKIFQQSEGGRIQGKPKLFLDNSIQDDSFY